MATTPANSVNLTQDQLAKWLIEDLPYRIQIARIFPFMGIQGGKISYARTPVLETEANISSMATILGEGGTSGITKTADPAASNSTFTLGELATRYKIEYSSMDRFRYPNNLDAVESALAIRRLIYMFYRKLDLATTGNPGDFPSLSDMCLATQRFASAAAPVAAAARIDEPQKAYSLIKSNNGRPNAIMCNSRWAGRARKAPCLRTASGSGASRSVRRARAVRRCLRSTAHPPKSTPTGRRTGWSRSAHRLRHPARVITG